MEVEAVEIGSTALAVLAVAFVLAFVPLSALARGWDLTLLQICFRESMAAVRVLLTPIVRNVHKIYVEIGQQQTSRQAAGGNGGEVEQLAIPYTVC